MGRTWEDALRDHRPSSSAGSTCCGRAVRNAQDISGRRFTIDAAPDPEGEWQVIGWEVPAKVVPLGQLDADEPRFKEHAHG